MKRKKTLRNLALAIVGSIALLVALTAGGLLPAGFGASKEVKAYAAEQIVPMNGEVIGQVLAGAGDKPTLVFAYASWCPWCKKQFVMLKALKARYGEDELKMVYISLDHDVYALSKFMMEHYPHKPFIPYHVSDEDWDSFKTALSEHGFNNSGTIPYMALVDKNGSPAGEFRGLTQIPVLLDAVKKAV